MVSAFDITSSGALPPETDTPAPSHFGLIRAENGWIIRVDCDKEYVALSELHALEILTSLLVPAAPDYARDDEA